MCAKLYHQQSAIRLEHSSFHFHAFVQHSPNQYIPIVYLIEDHMATTFHAPHTFSKVFCGSSQARVRTQQLECALQLRKVPVGLIRTPLVFGIATNS